MLDCLLQNCQIVRGGKMYDTKDGCACQYHFSKVFFLLSDIAAGCIIVIYWSIYAPGHVKDIADGLNAIDKWCISQCFFYEYPRSS